MEHCRLVSVVGCEANMCHQSRSRSL